jgi:amidase
LERKISARELLKASLEQIERTNPVVNAIVTMDPEGAMRQAEEADAALARGEVLGPLHGLVMAHKDLVATKGMRTTLGSPSLADWIPDEDISMVAKMRAAGGIRLGKTNVPQHGAGSHTFNPVFGATLNPWNQGRSAGGSSGGAGAALATGMVSVADGSDLGGSLRNPASFNSVVGFRSTIGSVSRTPVATGWISMSVLGAMGRTVRDMALLHSVISGFDARDPNSLPGDGSAFATLADSPAGADLAGVKIGWSPALGGLAVEPEVTAVLEGAGRPVLAGLGAEISAVDLDFEGAEPAFKVLRAWDMVQKHLNDYHHNRENLSRNVIDNVEMGLDLTAADIHDAYTARTRLFSRFVELFDKVDMLAMPTVQVAPFPVEWNHPEVVAGEVQDDYLGWMRSCWYVTATGMPAISVPCGFTPEGLPVGIQLVGRPMGDVELVRSAIAFEDAHPVWKTHPPIALGEGG